MCLGYCFHGIGNQFPTGQAVFHPGVVHNNAIAHGNSINLKRNTSPLSYTRLRRLCNVTQVHMPGNNLAVAVDDTDKRLIHFRAVAAQSV